MAKYFIYPFGVSGDKTAIPNATQPSGAVSYQEGWGHDYQLQLGVDPDARPIPRDQTNQLMFDITTAIQQYQQNGAPDWVPAADNLGVALPYPLFAIVRYDDGSGVKVFMSLVAANTATPSVGGVVNATWRVLSATSIPIGAIIDFGGSVAPDGHLICNGTAYSRTTYSALLAAITINQTCTLSSSVNVTVTDNSNMYVGMSLEGTGIPSGTTVASVNVDGTHITISAAATLSGSELLRFFSWGNGDGATTFNVPDLRRRVTVGSGGSGTAVLGKGTGQNGGEEAHVQTTAEVGSHAHTAHFNFTIDSFSPSGTDGMGADTGGPATHSVAVDASPTAAAANIMQPSSIVTKVIKYA